jgi:hypothetical protein
MVPKLRPSVRMAAASLGLCCACASQPAPQAYDNRVFYEYDAGGDGNLSEILERPFDDLDIESSPRVFEGVEILGGVARYSRPKDWIIRGGSLRAEARFIEYVSPRQAVISVYERLESPEDTWGVVLERYEKDTEAQGGLFQGKAVPIATFDSQGRAYDVKRGVPAGVEPFISYSREYVMRSDNRIVLIQIVRPREDFGEAEPELLDFVRSIRVL